MPEILQMLLYFCVFVLGVILGRVSMAVQFAVATVKKDKQNKEIKQSQSVSFSK